MKGGSQLRTPDATCPGCAGRAGMSLLLWAAPRLADQVPAVLCQELPACQAAEKLRGPIQP